MSSNVLQIECCLSYKVVVTGGHVDIYEFMTNLPRDPDSSLPDKNFSELLSVSEIFQLLWVCVRPNMFKTRVIRREL